MRGLHAGLWAVLWAALLLGWGVARGDTSDAKAAAELWREGARLHLEGAYDQAVARYRESIALHPTARAHTYLGWSLSELGRLQEAIAECRKAIELDPGYGNPYNDIGAYLVELERPREAVPWLRRALAAERYCCRHYTHFHLGRAYLLQGAVSRAERAFARSLALRPRYWPARKALELLRARGFRGL